MFNKKEKKKNKKKGNKSAKNDASFVKSQQELNKRFSRDEKDLRTIRIITAGFILSVAMNIALTGTLMLMVPLKQPIPYLITAHSEQEVFVRARPINRLEDPDKLILENIVRVHITLRNEVIPHQNEMIRRWGQNSAFRAITNPVMYNNFAETMQNIMVQIDQIPFYRIVKIKNVTSEDAINYKVLFTTTESVSGARAAETVENIREWSALVSLERVPLDDPRSTNLDLRLHNPIGVQVKSYFQEELINNSN